MRRHCDGNDPNLVMHVEPKTGTLVGLDHDHLIETVEKPCTCGKVFDDVRYSTIYPHRAI